MMRVLLMCLMLALGGVNLWAIMEHDGGLMSYVAAATCFGVAVYGIASLVRYP